MRAARVIAAFSVVTLLNVLFIAAFDPSMFVAFAYGTLMMYVALGIAEGEW